MSYSSEVMEDDMAYPSIGSDNVYDANYEFFSRLVRVSQVAANLKGHNTSSTATIKE
jgi:hypothetical protein